VSIAVRFEKKTEYSAASLATRFRSHAFELAKLVNMRVTSFHRQFRAVTAMSPLQYQKARLQEARRLMLTASLDAGAAGRRVGYLSASRFSREYGRFFGSAPIMDINRLREHGFGAAEASA
jgi:transcriptional regulator GlxA family with amidase domain